MREKPRIGFIGVGLMGHGAAKNIVEKGYPLTVLGRRNRQPVEDLLARGAREAADAAAAALGADVLFLCLPSTVEVEQAVYGPGGVLEGCHDGLVVVDCTTADPVSTRRIGADLAARGAAMVDAAMGRTPKEAEAGRLSTYVGGDPAVIARIRPILSCYAETIIETGPLGSGTTMKLINNFISIGTATVIAEALATASKLGVDLAKLCEVVSAGGANSAMFQMIAPWVLAGDDSHLKGPIRIVAKDIRTYAKLAEAAPATAFVAQAVNQLCQLARIQGHDERFLPVLPGILADLIGAPIRPLDPPADG